MADNRTGKLIKTKSGEFVTTQLSDGTDSLAINADGSINSVVTATDLDIRNLAPATDTVAIGDGTHSLDVNADGSINSVVTATDLDIRNLAPATDKVAIGDGTHDLDVNADGSINAVVTATDLDIRALASGTDSVTVVATDLDVRDLTHASDSVKVGDGTDFLAVNADGSINVVVSSTAATPVHFTDEENVVAQNATETVDRTITDTKTFTGGSLKVGTLGQCKIKVGVWNGAAYEANKSRVFFQNAGENVDHDLSWLVHLGDGTDTVRVAVTNLDDETNVSIAFSGSEI